ncbi:hypothetical protein V7157_18050 [Neobacillus drentensis]
MQPWNFIMVSSDEIKERLAWAAEKEQSIGHCNCL